MSKLSLNKLRKYRSLMKQGVPTRCGPAILQVPRSWLRRLPETERYSIRECLVKVLRCVRKEKRHHAEVVRGVARRAISIAEISAAWGAVVGGRPPSESTLRRNAVGLSRGRPRKRSALEFAWEEISQNDIDVLCKSFRHKAALCRRRGSSA